MKTSPLEAISSLILNEIQPKILLTATDIRSHLERKFNPSKFERLAQRLGDYLTTTDTPPANTKEFNEQVAKALGIKSALVNSSSITVAGSTEKIFQLSSISGSNQEDNNTLIRSLNSLFLYRFIENKLEKLKKFVADLLAERAGILESIDFNSPEYSGLTEKEKNLATALVWLRLMEKHGEATNFSNERGQAAKTRILFLQNIHESLSENIKNLLKAILRYDLLVAAKNKDKLSLDLLSQIDGILSTITSSITPKLKNITTNSAHTTPETVANFGLALNDRIETLSKPRASSVVSRSSSSGSDRSPSPPPRDISAQSTSFHHIETAEQANAYFTVTVVNDKSFEKFLKLYLHAQNLMMRREGDKGYAKGLLILSLIKTLRDPGNNAILALNSFPLNVRKSDQSLFGHLQNEWWRRLGRILFSFCRPAETLTEQYVEELRNNHYHEANTYVPEEDTKRKDFEKFSNLYQHAVRLVTAGRKAHSANAANSKSEGYAKGILILDLIRKLRSSNNLSESEKTLSTFTQTKLELPNKQATDKTAFSHRNSGLLRSLGRGLFGCCSKASQTTTEQHVEELKAAHYSSRG